MYLILFFVERKVIYVGITKKNSEKGKNIYKKTKIAHIELYFRKQPGKRNNINTKKLPQHSHNVERLTLLTLPFR